MEFSVHGKKTVQSIELNQMLNEIEWKKSEKELPLQNANGMRTANRVPYILTLVCNWISIQHSAISYFTYIFHLFFELFSYYCFVSSFVEIKQKKQIVYWMANAMNFSIYFVCSCMNTRVQVEIFYFSFCSSWWEKQKKNWVKSTQFIQWTIAINEVAYLSHFKYSLKPCNFQ